MSRRRRGWIEARGDFEAVVDSDLDTKQRSRDLLQVEEGSLSPALRRLLKEELVDATWEVSATRHHRESSRLRSGAR